MLLPTCCSIQSLAFRENPEDVALKHYTAYEAEKLGEKIMKIWARLFKASLA